MIFLPAPRVHQQQQPGGRAAATWAAPRQPQRPLAPPMTPTASALHSRAQRSVELARGGLAQPTSVRVVGPPCQAGGGRVPLSGRPGKLVWGSGSAGSPSGAPNAEAATLLAICGCSRRGSAGLFLRLPRILLVFIPVSSRQ